MTRRMSLFDHPFFLGFDQLEREFDRLKKSADGYPPYNVEQIDDSGLRITLAVAGFTHDDLDIELAHNQLTVRGKIHEDDEDGRVFLHRGIAARQFQRSFMIADGIEIKGASLDNGLLHIEMQRVIPETQSRKINIEYSGANNAATNRKEQLPAQDIEVERQNNRDVASLKTAQKTAQETRKRG